MQAWPQRRAADFATAPGKHVAKEGSEKMPILLWLLGIPIPLIILVMLLR